MSPSGSGSSGLVSATRRVRQSFRGRRTNRWSPRTWRAPFRCGTSSTGQKQKELPQPQQRSSRRIRSARLAWAAVGNRLATLVGGQVELWDPETDERLPLTGNNEHVRFNNHALHSRRQLLATTVGYEAARSALWDLKTLRPLLRIDEEGWEFSLSPNGRRLAAWKSKSLSRSDTPVDLEVRFYDLPEAKQTGSIEVRLSRLPLGQWSPDSRLLALYCEHHPHAVVLDGTKLLHTLGKLQPRADRNPIDRAERIAWSSGFQVHRLEP